MLTIERKPGTSVIIGDDIKVQVRWIRGKNAVRLAITAPKDTPIIREELIATIETSSPEDAKSLPARIETQPVSSESNLEASKTAQATEKEQRPKIDPSFCVVVVEDDPTHALLIRESFKQFGVENLEVLNSGSTALERLINDESKSLPSLITLDLGLPDLSGMEVLQKLRGCDRTRALPVVVLSSTDDDEYVNACIERGANAFVSKAPNFEEFRDAIIRIAEFWTMSRLRA